MFTKLITLFLLMSLIAGGASLSAQDTETWVLGVVMPFSGNLGSFGQDFARGAELAVAQMNDELEAAGSAVRFEIASADTENTPEGASRALQTVVQTTGAQVVVGPLTTSEVLGAKQFADENGVVIVAPASSGAAAAIPGDNIYRVIYPPDVYSSKAYATIALQRGHNNMVVLHLDDPFGNGMNEHFVENFHAGGGGEVASFAYTPGSTELSSEAAAVSAALARFGGDAGFFCVCFLSGAQAFLQVAQIDPMLTSVKWLGNEAMKDPQLLEDPGHAQVLANAEFLTISESTAATPLTQIFIDDFSEMFGQPPGIFTNYAFDAANIAMLTMLTVGNDGAAVKSMLPFISNHYIGTTVQAFLDANGDQAIASYGIYQTNAAGTAHEVVGTYDGNTNTIDLQAPPSPPAAEASDATGLSLADLSQGGSELMRFLVVVSHELNVNAHWPSDWGHYWLYSDRAASAADMPPFGLISGDFDMPPYLTRLSFIVQGESVSAIEFNHHDGMGSWDAARQKSLFVAGIDRDGEIALVELGAGLISQLDSVTLKWSVPGPHKATLWDFFGEIISGDSDAEKTLAFVLADPGSVALAG